MFWMVLVSNSLLCLRAASCIPCCAPAPCPESTKACRHVFRDTKGCFLVSSKFAQIFREIQVGELVLRSPKNCAPVDVARRVPDVGIHTLSSDGWKNDRIIMLWCACLLGIGRIAMDKPGAIIYMWICSWVSHKRFQGGQPIEACQHIRLLHSKHIGQFVPNVS